MHVLVTGGAGYIGSVTARTLLDRGHDVTVVDDLRTGHRAAVDPRAVFVEADVGDTQAMTRAVAARPVDAVVHFAASSLVGESMERPTLYFSNNSASTLRLLDVIINAGVKRFVLSSTAALYGTPEATPIPESARIQPESVYGESKYLIERALAWLARTAGLGAVALRYFNAAGASGELGEDHRPESHLIPIVLQVALGQRDRVAVFGDDYPTDDGSAVRDYIHVDDLADAHVRAVEALTPGRFDAFNVGTGQGYSVREVIEACRTITGHAIPADAVDRRAGDPPSLVADASRLQESLGWQATRSDLQEIVRSAWTWHQAHPNGYQDA